MSIRITAKPRRGIRRVGRHHPAEPVVFPDGYFDDAEMEILRTDPQLVVEEGIEQDLQDKTDVRSLSGRSGTPAAKAGAAVSSSADAGDSGKRSSGAERPDASAAASGGAVTDASTQLADGAGDQTTAQEDVVERAIQEALSTPVAQLEGYITGVTDIETIREMQRRDTRKSAQPIYDAWIDQLTPGASRQGG